MPMEAPLVFEAAEKSVRFVRSICLCLNCKLPSAHGLIFCTSSETWQRDTVTILEFLIDVVAFGNALNYLWLVFTSAMLFIQWCSDGQCARRTCASKDKGTGTSKAV
jgi:hypothetical protein